MARVLVTPATPDVQPFDTVRTPLGEGVVYAIRGGRAYITYPQAGQSHPLSECAMVCRPIWRESDGAWRHVSRTHPGITYTLRETDGGGWSCTCPGNTYHGYCAHAVNVATVKDYLMARDTTPEPNGPGSCPCGRGCHTETRQSPERGPDPDAELPEEVRRWLQSIDMDLYDRGLDYFFSAKSRTGERAMAA